ncbi:molybdate ABC transporter substrate-binding protein [Corallincola platygyrae]|uniref:Molybdate ABC transporter substrate-binding protein n=1 Tax=Corallincola platygyrae TaxID=1193278 RepID=A0ABW4XG92_9GAMM
MTKRILGIIVCRRCAIFLTVLALFSASGTAFAKEPRAINVAVAANFYQPLKRLSEQYRQETGVAINISAASTGVLFQQIVHGAPFDLYLAADADRPQQLHERGLSLGEPFVYARGVLAFWCPGCRDVSLDVVKRWQDQFSMANPKTAPYGAAASQVVQRFALPNDPAPAVGNSVSQAYQFISTGNVKAGFVAYSQVVDQPINAIKLPFEWYSPIVQKGVILKRSENLDKVRQFVQFLAEQSGPVLTEMGYLPAMDLSLKEFPVKGLAAKELSANELAASELAARGANG